MKVWNLFSLFTIRRYDINYPRMKNKVKSFLCDFSSFYLSVQIFPWRNFMSSVYLIKTLTTGHIRTLGIGHDNDINLLLQPRFQGLSSFRTLELSFLAPGSSF